MSLAAAEVDMVHQLAELIHYQSTKIFKGEGRLNVSTQTLVFLNQAMQEQYRSNFGNENDLILTLDQKRMLNTVKDDIHFVTEVLVHTTSLKLYHQSHSIPGPLDIGMFNYLTEIDINRIPIHLIQGLQKLRLTLQHITINRSLCSLKSVFEKCGGDMSGPLSWQKLESANLSQNSIQELDSSLKLLPMLKYLDLSHNNLKTTGRYLENLLYVECLNLAFNHLTNLPSLSFHTKSSLTSLILRNNSLYNLDGVEELGHLIELDVSGNLLADHSCLAVISGMHRLTKLTLFDNPMTYRTDHRTKAVGHISPLVNGNGILLDGKSLTYSELKAIQRNKITKSASFYFRPQMDSSHTICDSGISDLNCEEEQIAEPVKKKRSQCKKSFRNSRISSERNSPIPQLSIGSDSSRTSSPQGSVTSMSIREIEQLREFHGDNWLQQYEHMRENRELLTNSPEMDNYEESDRPPSPAEEDNDAAVVPTEIKPESYPGFEDPFLENNNKEPSLENNNKRSQNGSATPEQKAESDDEQSDEVSILSHESSENNTESESNGLMSDEIDSDIKKMASVENPYGEETEPFIVKRSLDEDAEEIFVSSNERFLIEKDLQGCQLDRLDMKCVTYMSVLKNKGQMVVKLKFNYVKQDRRERTYVMVDKDEADELEKIIMPFLEEHQLKVNAKDVFHLMCLKCSYNFTKVVEAANKTLISKGSPKKATKDVCPKCQSYNVVCQPAGSVRRDEPPQKSSVFALFSSSSNPSSGSTTPVNDASPLLRRKGAISKRRKHLTPRDINSLTPYSDDAQSLQNWSQSAENISQICVGDSPDKGRPASFNLEATQTWSETQDNIDTVNTDEDQTVPRNLESENTPILQLACEKVLKENGHSYAINMQKRKGLCLNSSPSLSLTPPDSFLTSNVCHSMVSSVYKHTLQPVGNVEGDIPKISVEEFGKTIAESDDDLEECDSRTDKESSIQPIDETAVDVSPQLTHDVTADMVSLSDSTDTNSDITALSESVDPEMHKDDIACIHLDHQIHLFLVMKHFQHAERYTFSIKSPVVQHIVGEYNGLMVMSTVNIFIFTLKGSNPSDNPENFVKLKSKHAITDLKYIDIGLGYQSFRLEFDSECGSYSFLVKDEHVVRRFVSTVVEISQKFVNLGQMGPVKVGQYHHETMENIRQLLHRNDSSENMGIDVDHPEKSLITYLMATQLKDEKGEQKLPVSIAVLGTLLYLLIENHQWPMPRLQPKMPYDNIGHQFLVLDKQNILDITSLKIWKANEKRLRLTFLNEISGCEFHWDFAFENNRSVTKLMQSVKSPWEAKYKVDLEVVLVS